MMRRLFRIARVDRDVNDEIAFHLESRVRDLMTSGMTHDAAWTLARREFGDVDDARRELVEHDRHRAARRDVRERLEAILQDVRYTARALVAAPGLTLAVIVLVALGAGANAATFSVANELFLRPPARVADPASVARLYLRTNESRNPDIRSKFFYPAFGAISDALAPVATVAAYIHPDSATARIGTDRLTVFASYVSPNFLSLLGVPIAFGRAFDPHDDAVKADAPIAVISYALWQSRFGGDPDALGKSIEVTNERYSIVGIAAQGFSGIDLDRADVWLPIATFPWMQLREAWYSNWRGQLNTQIIVRAHPGVDARRLEAIATAVNRRGEVEHLAEFADTTASVLTGPLLESLGPRITPSVQSAITTRLIGVALILLIVACANVANLLLLRSERRGREIALRLALGISRRRLLVQLLIESVMLSVPAGAVALIIGAWGGALLRSALMRSVQWAGGALDWRVAIIAIAIACVAGIIGGIAPASRALRVDPALALKAGTTGAGVERSRLRTALLIAQTALSVVLLVGAGLFVRSLRAVRSTDLGYDVERVAYGQISFRDPTGRYIDFLSHRFDDERTQGLRSIAERLRNTANIEDVALGTGAPMGGYAATQLFLGDRTVAPRVGIRAPAVYSVSPSYATVSGLRMARGRWLRDNDRLGTEPAIVVNETAARTYWPGRDPIGQCLIVMDPAAVCATVVGVTHDAHLSDYVEPPVVEAFLPMAQQRGRYLSQPNTVIIRARAGRMAQAASDLRHALAQTFPNAEPPDVHTMVQAREPELRRWRVGAELFGLFGILALIVATFGVYSSIAYAVSQRTRELGVRIALGAPRRRIVATVTRLIATPLSIGVICGIALSAVLGRFIVSLLYGVSVTDSLTLVSVSVVVLAAGAVGMIVPACRALRVDPVRALRAD